MTNQDFIELVVRDKKVPYDNNLLTGLLYQYFKNAIEFLEKQIDFDYAERTSLFTVLKDNYSIPFTTEKVKKIYTLFDKTHGFELYGDYDTTIFYRMFEDKPAIPKRYVVSNNTIYFSTPLKENTEYVIRYFVFTYNNPVYVDLDKTHPLIEINPQLLISTLGLFIDRYYSPSSLDSDFVKTLQVIEKATQNQKRATTLALRIDYPRY